MRFFKNQLLLFTAVLLLPGFVCAGEVVDKMYLKKNFDGSKDREYSVFLPQGYDSGENLPLVVVLHGCKQTNQDIMHDTRFNELAENEKFVVVYPFITEYDGLRDTNCWGFWFEDEIQEGRGEAADIAGIIEEVQGAYPIDSARIHITGLSSGGAMAVAVMVAYSEKIASGAPAAGLAYGESACAVSGVCLNFNPFNPATWIYWYSARFESTRQTVEEMTEEMGEDRRLVPVLALHSTDDSKVEISAAENNVAAWAELFDVELNEPVSSEEGETEGVAYHYNRYGSYGGSSAIETYFVDGPRHGWVGGAEGRYSDPDGPDWTAITWEFFKAHPFLPVE